LGAAAAEEVGKVEGGVDADGGVFDSGVDSWGKFRGMEKQKLG
jgi:hypothetical protein